jgi:hypothetical protein
VDGNHRLLTYGVEQGSGVGFGRPPNRVLEVRLKVGITLDLYSHVVPGMQEEAAAKLEALIFG